MLARGRSRMTLLNADDADVVRHLLARLDPSRAAPVARGIGPGTLIGMAGELHEAGFLVADDVVERWSVPLRRDHEARPEGLRGRTVAVSGGGQLARHVTDVLGELAARVIVASPTDPGALAGAELAVISPDGPDLAVLNDVTEYALDAGVVSLPVFHLGDEGVVGPLAARGRGCFRCWELRWLGLAPSPAAEVRLHRHLRAGGWRLETGRDPVALRYLAEEAALRAATWFARGWDALVRVVDFDAGRLATHLLVTHPGCGLCTPAFREPGPPDAASVLSGTTANPASAESLAPLGDARLGIATGVPLEADPPQDREVTPLFVAHAQFAEGQPEPVLHDSDRFTHGAAATVPEAVTVALAEALERYCGIFVPPPAVSAAYDDVAGDAMWPPSLPLYSQRQYASPGFPFRPFDAREELPWAWGYNLTQGRPQLVPQAATRYGALSTRLVHETSSGVAAHSSPAAAVLGATLEVVERDALMIAWLNRLSPPLLDLTTVRDAFVRSAVAEVGLSGYGLHVADMTTDLGIPVILAVALREDGAAPALMLGAGCALDRLGATRKALRELLGGIRGRLGVPWSLPEPMEAHEVRELADHGRAYHHPAALPRACFLWASPERAAPLAEPTERHTVGEQLATCVTLLGRAGVDLLAVDLTTPDVAPYLRVFRAVTPGLQPIGFGPHGTRLGGRRLYTAPVAMGYTTVETTEQSLNPDPHCYP